MEARVLSVLLIVALVGGATAAGVKQEISFIQSMVDPYVDCEFGTLSCSDDCKNVMFCLGGTDLEVVEVCHNDNIPDSPYCDLSTTTCNATICNSVDKSHFYCYGATGGKYPNPYDCHSYYSCEDGITVPVEVKSEQCKPNTTAFDSLSGTCRLSSNHRVCKEGPVPKCTTQGQSGSIIENPNMLYVCVTIKGALQPILLRCPEPNLIFVDGDCIDPEETTTSGTGPTTTATATTPEVTTTSTGTTPEITTTSPGTTPEVTTTSTGTTPEVTTTSTGTTPEVTTTSTGTTPEVTTSTGTTPEVTTSTGTTPEVTTSTGTTPEVTTPAVECEFGTLSCSKDCFNVMICLLGNNLQVVEACQPSNGFCDVSTASCNKDLTSCNATVDTNEFHCYGEVGGRYPNPFDCHSYYTCPDNADPSVKVPVEMCKSPTTAFDALSGTCRLSSNHRVCTEGPVPKCTAQSQSGALVENPNIYYVCVTTNGVLHPLLLRCVDPSYVFMNGKCVDPESTTTTGPTTTPTGPTTTPTETTTATGSTTTQPQSTTPYYCTTPGTTVPDPANCHAYYLCTMEMEQIHFVCQQGYRYDSTLHRCVKGSC